MKKESTKQLLTALQERLRLVQVQVEGLFLLTQRLSRSEQNLILKDMDEVLLQIQVGLLEVVSSICGQIVPLQSLGEEDKSK